MRCPRCQHRLPLGHVLRGAGDDLPCQRCGAPSQMQPWPVLAAIASAGTVLAAAATIGLPAWIGAPLLIGGWTTWVYARTPVSCLPAASDREHLPPAQVRRYRKQRKR